MAYTRHITINSKNVSSLVNACSFSWSREGGCERASLAIASAEFDDFIGIEIDHEVVISYTSGQPWWRGVVAELSTSVASGLSISCVGSKTLLANIIPHGLYGTDVETLPVTEMLLTSVSTSGRLAPGAYKYWVTVIDDYGETKSGTLAGGQAGNYLDIAHGYYASVTLATGSPTPAYKVTLTFTDTTARGNYYRIYRQIDAGALKYVEIKGTSFVDDGMGKWTSTAITTPGSANTRRVPTIVSAVVSDVVSDILTKYLPASMSVGTISIDNDEELDDFDVDRSTATLQQVLNSLAEICGNILWGVDEDNAVYFITATDALLATFQFNTGTLDQYDNNVAVSASRQVTRDGVTKVNIIGEEAFDNRSVVIQRSGWDDSLTTGSSSTNNSTRDYRAYSTDVDADAPTITPTKAFLDTYATLADWLADFPNLRWIWLLKEELTTDYITSYLTSISETSRKTATVIDGGGTVYGSSGPRARYVNKRLAGIKTVKLAGKAAANFMFSHNPNPSKWSVQLERVSTFYRPIDGIVRLRTPNGTRYDLDVQSIDFTFEETVIASFTAGDKVYAPNVEDEINDIRDTLNALALRPMPLDWRTKLSSRPPLSIRVFGDPAFPPEADPGDDESIARANHSHVIDAAEVSIWLPYEGA